MVITKKEVLVSIVIVAVMLFFGILISSRIEDIDMQQIKELKTAIRVDTNYAFDYGMKTNVGNTLAYGELTAIDAVSFPELAESFLYISRTEEKHTKHSRVISDGEKKKTLTYWRWDNTGRDVLISGYVLFLGKEMSTSCLHLPSAHSLRLSSEATIDRHNVRGNYIYKSKSVRYSYNYIPMRFKCTLHCNLENGSVGKSATVYKDQTIQNVVDEHVQSSEINTIVFWIGWVVIICLCVCGFYVMENRWFK